MTIKRRHLVLVSILLLAAALILSASTLTSVIVFTSLSARTFMIFALVSLLMFGHCAINAHLARANKHD